MTRYRRRLTSALAALAAVAVTVMWPAQPAAAAPGDPQCTVAEWRNPLQYRECTGRLVTGAQTAVTCLQAPEPQNPTTGTAGWVSARPADTYRNGVEGMYGRYGVAGYQVVTYDTSCAGAVLHPQANMQTAVADLEFGFAVMLIGVANTLREYAYNPQRMWSWADPALEAITRTVFEQVFSVWGALAIALLAVWLIWHARRGDMSTAFRAAVWAVAVTAGVTALASWPTTSVKVADTAATTGLTVVQSVLTPGTGTPATCPDPEPEACVDRRSPALRASDNLTETVLYEQWLRATLGSADSPTAVKYGPALHDAATLTWREAAEIEAHPELRQVIVDTKKQQWRAVAAQIKTEDPEAYEHLRGMRGGDRLWTGLWAALSALLLVAFDMWASTVILLAYLIFRLAVVVAPLAATVGVHYKASGVLRRLGNIVAVAAINVVWWGAAVSLYMWVASWVLRADSLPGVLRPLVVALVGAACWWGLRRSRSVVTSHLPAAPESDGNSRVASLLGRLQGGAARVNRHRTRLDDLAGRLADSGIAPVAEAAGRWKSWSRPEGRPSPWTGFDRTAKRIDAAAARVAAGRSGGAA